jgi:HTH-type transcriptional regulator / antitoxin HigA
MITKQPFKYTPDYAVSPGEILEETLDARNIKKSDLAERINMSAKTISQILSGKAPVNVDTAIQLEKVLGIPASTWNNLECNYRLFQARKNRQQELARYSEWAKAFPVTKLVSWGFIQKANSTEEQVEQLLGFFGVGSVEAWQTKMAGLNVKFRRSAIFETSQESVATWLRIGEIKAEVIKCEPFDDTKFRVTLAEVKHLTCADPVVFQKEMIKLCAAAGVALVFFPELPGTHICGATEWLGKDKALLMLSMRYKTDDHLWFSFFHEAAHILLHGKKSVFVEKEKVELDEQESQANKFASDFLIPPESYRSLLTSEYHSPGIISNFAKQNGITPGIVIGRLQYDEYLPYKSPLNKLKSRLEFN